MKDILEARKMRTILLPFVRYGTDIDDHRLPIFALVCLAEKFLGHHHMPNHTNSKENAWEI